MKVCGNPEKQTGYFTLEMFRKVVDEIYNSNPQPHVLLSWRQYQLYKILVDVGGINEVEAGYAAQYL